MKSIVAGLIAAVLFVAGGMVCLAEARHTRRLADARLRLATLQYTDEGDLSSDATVLQRLPPPLGIAQATEQRHAATVSYWLARYTSLTDLTSALGPAPSDPALLLMAANAAFRTSAPQSEDRKAVVTRLDTVVQAYADVLRKDGSLSDAAYNYEYVSKLRDTVARGPARPARGARDAKPAAPPVDDPGDLPGGPTIHGRPGGPPDETPMSDFKTITPMRYDEREEQTDPGRGQKIQRKG